ncbi:hypothetical protein ACJX0J_022984, partial [Zea mays]
AHYIRFFVLVIYFFSIYYNTCSREVSLPTLRTNSNIVNLLYKRNGTEECSGIGGVILDDFPEDVVNLAQQDF